MRNTILLLLFTMFVTACQPADRTFSKYGISFTYPAGWQIEDNVESKTTSRVQLTRKGPDSGGIAIIRIFDEEDKAGTHIDSYTIGIRQEGILEHMQIEERIPDSYGAYAGSSVSYTGTGQGKPYTGKIYVLQSGGRSCWIITQEALAEQEENRPCRELMEKIFSIAPLSPVHKEFEEIFDIHPPEG